MLDILNSRHGHPSAHALLLPLPGSAQGKRQAWMAGLLSKRLVLWSEMVKDTSITYNQDNPVFLRKLLDMSSQEEHPVVLQLGGSDPETLAHAVRLASPWSYDEINLNCGCPSEAAVKTRQGHGFGAQLMTCPELVRACTEAMQEAASVGVSVKCRIWTHPTLADLERDGDRFETLLRFVDTVSAGGVAGQVKNNCRAFDSSTFVGSTIWGTS
ncbi:tRNA-dihydrouridine(20/20a) synthase (U20-specific dihydrouridine synthase) (U20-specific Dus) (tRNA-dihydrouridine synthase A) [Durusdinium trenchii]|uniref:tRNA-dihydrouridine(20/20a) synthase (U20-specific dihydrouridine synthase) (U20-specific Dus) (tRNA-dihydrouridine synthase A) n=1 Tax=Durusdinium trenchii TaxID=1381693 RepID=A0ABP0MZI3_9DINO